MAVRNKPKAGHEKSFHCLESFVAITATNEPTDPSGII